MHGGHGSSKITSDIVTILTLPKPNAEACLKDMRRENSNLPFWNTLLRIIERNENSDEAVIGLILSGLPLSRDAILSILRSFDKHTVNLLLAWKHLSVDDEMIQAGADNEKHKAAIDGVLRDRVQTGDAPEKALIVALRDQNATTILPLLFQRFPDIHVGLAALEEALKYAVMPTMILEALLKYEAKRDGIESEVILDRLLRVSVGHEHSDTLRDMLAICTSSVHVSWKMAGQGEIRGLVRVLNIALERGTPVTFDPQVAARCAYFLKQTRTTPGQESFWKLLEKHRYHTETNLSEIDFTIAVTDDVVYLDYLLRMAPHIKINPALIEGVLANTKRRDELISILLKEDERELEITETVIRMVGQDLYGRQKLLPWLFTRMSTGHKVEFPSWIPPFIEAGHTAEDVVELLLTIDPKLHCLRMSGTSPEATAGNELVLNHHRQFCVHDIRPDHLSELLDLSIDGGVGLSEGNTDLIKDSIFEACGFAGWTAALDLPRVETEGVQIEEMQHLNVTVGSLNHSTSSNMLEKLCRVLNMLLLDDHCCSYFTVLVNSRPGVVEMVRIDFEVIERLRRSVTSLQESRDIHLMEETRCQVERAAIQASNSILSMVFGDSIQRDDDNMEGEIVDQMVSLATGLLCFGLLCFSQGPLGPLEPPNLLWPVWELKLSGHESSDSRQGISLKQVRLTCLNGMLGRPVLVFCDPLVQSSTYHSAPVESFDSFEDLSYSVEACHLLASPEDIIDTWGPARLIIDAPTPDAQPLSLKALEIGGGTIYKLSSLPSAWPNAANGAYHWKPGSITLNTELQAFELSRKILIGAVNVNAQCVIDVERRINKWTTNFGYLETFEPSWQHTQTQAGLQGGQYLALQFNATWIKRPGTTLKDVILLNLKDVLPLPYLSKFCAVQVSACTGIARRVRLRTLIADNLQPFMSAILPEPKGYSDLLIKNNIEGRLRSDDFEQWIKQQSTKLHELLRFAIEYILTKMRFTGFDAVQNELVIACRVRNNPFLCIRLPCCQSAIWPRILADSQNGAAFAYFTGDCLQTASRTCQGMNTRLCQSRVFCLDTSILTVPRRSSKMVVNNVQLENNVKYGIGKPDSKMVVKARTLQGTTHLMVEHWAWMPNYIFKAWASKVDKITECDKAETGAIEVYIMDADP